MASMSQTVTVRLPGPVNPQEIISMDFFRWQKMFLCHGWKELAGTCNHPSKESVVVTSCLTHDWATKCSIMYHYIYQETKFAARDTFLHIFHIHGIYGLWSSYHWNP